VITGSDLSADGNITLKQISETNIQDIKWQKYGTMDSFV
jgi:hypothetical protein